MKNALYFLVFAVLYKLSVNLSSLIRLNHYKQMYEEYLRNVNTQFREYSVLLSKLFIKAGLKDTSFQGGYLYDNLIVKHEGIVALVLRYFDEAKGIFKNRILESLSPLYWINFLIYLPKNLFLILGLDPESTVTKIFQLLYWVITPSAIMFRDILNEYIKSLVG